MRGPLLHFPTLFLLLVATTLAGCGEAIEEPNGYNIEFVNNFPARRLVDIVIVDGTAGPENDWEHYQIFENNHFGANIGCVGFTNPFHLKAIQKSGSTYNHEPGARVLDTKKWAVECGEHYTLVIDETDEMNLYLGEQSRAPFKNPLREIP